MFTYNEGRDELDDLIDEARQGVREATDSARKRKRSESGEVSSRSPSRVPPQPPAVAAKTLEATDHAHAETGSTVTVAASHPSASRPVNQPQGKTKCKLAMRRSFH